MAPPVPISAFLRRCCPRHDPLRHPVCGYFCPLAFSSGSLPQGIIIPAIAPATRPAPIPTKNPVQLFILTHSFSGMELVWTAEARKNREKEICQKLLNKIY